HSTHTKAAPARTPHPAAPHPPAHPLSTSGGFGGRPAAPVTAPPQVAILGAGRVAPRAVVADGKLVAQRLLPLSLTFDHRAVTGGEAARFLNAAIEDLERSG